MLIALIFLEVARQILIFYLTAFRSFLGIFGCKVYSTMEFQALTSFQGFCLEWTFFLFHFSEVYLMMYFIDWYQSFPFQGRSPLLNFLGQESHRIQSFFEPRVFSCNVNYLTIQIAIVLVSDFYVLLPCYSSQKLALTGIRNI